MRHPRCQAPRTGLLPMRPPLDWSPEEMADDWSTDIQAEPESTAEPETMTAPEIMAAPLDEDHFEFDDELMMALAEEPVREDHEVARRAGGRHLPIAASRLV